MGVDETPVMLTMPGERERREFFISTSWGIKCMEEWKTWVNGESLRLRQELVQMFHARLERLEREMFFPDGGSLARDTFAHRIIIAILVFGTLVNSALLIALLVLFFARAS